MCWGHRGNSQGDQYGWSTTGEGDSGRKVGWEGSQQPGRMVLVGHFKNFKVHSEVNGKWGKDWSEINVIIWLGFLKDHSESPVKVKPKGVKETVRRLFKRPLGRGIYRPPKQERRAALTLWIAQKQMSKFGLIFPRSCSPLISPYSGLLLHFHKQLQDLWPEGKNFFLSEPGWNPHWGAWLDHRAILRLTSHSLCPPLCSRPRGWGTLRIPGRSSRIKKDPFSVPPFF